MEQKQVPGLSRGALQASGVSVELGEFPERVLQIGEGNFMRGFIDWMLYRMNQRGCFHGRSVAIQPTPRGKVVPKLNRQDGLFTLVQRGLEKGEAIERVERIDVISRGINPYENWQEVLQVAESRDIRFVFSNTTEAGLQWSEEAYDPLTAPLSYPGKLVALLYHRFLHFSGAADAGWILLPCELVEKNGEVLQELCERAAKHWGLPAAFFTWMKEACVFCNTLVDRIVTGYPHGEENVWEDKLGYRDELLTVSEPYHLFVIEGPECLAEELPFQQADLRVYFDRIDAYRERKVKLLNAPHTLLASVAYLAGADTVREAVDDPKLRSYLLRAMQEEIKESLAPEVQAVADAYIEDVLQRFSNPYLQHRLLDISLNGLSKLVTRVLPSMHIYQKTAGALPQALVFGLVASFFFYRVARIEGESLYGVREDGTEYEIRDQVEHVHAIGELWKQVRENSTTASLALAVESYLGMAGIWGEDLNEVADLTAQATRYAEEIAQHGFRQALRNLG